MYTQGHTHTTILRAAEACWQLLQPGKQQQQLIFLSSILHIFFFLSPSFVGLLQITAAGSWLHGVELRSHHPAPPPFIHHSETLEKKIQHQTLFQCFYTFFSFSSLNLQKKVNKTVLLPVLWSQTKPLPAVHKSPLFAVHKTPSSSWRYERRWRRKKNSWYSRSKEEDKNKPPP